MNIYTPLESTLGNWIDGCEKTSFEDADIVLIPGGSDVNPALYGHSTLPSTFVDDTSDAAEMALINKAIEGNKFIIGICKGSQMLTARAGGWLIQHVTGHHGTHAVKTFDGETFAVNSSHHQMSYPYDLPDEDYKVLGWSKGLSQTYEFDITPKDSSWYDTKPDMIDNGFFKEPEVIFYPKIRGLGIQSHPEWPSMPGAFNDWLNELIPTLL